MVYRTTTLSPLFTLRRDLDRVFDDAFARAKSVTSWTPVTEVREDEQGYRIELEIPGVAPEQVEVTVEQGALTIRGENRAQQKFERSFTLPAQIAEESITATVAHGLLTVMMPKVKPVVRKIEVK